MKIILLGPPGCGKGTQGKIIEEKYKIPHISTGDIFRSVMKSDSELGNKVRTLIEKGELVSDELTNEIVFSKLAEESMKSGYILDGYPRTVGQAEALKDFLVKNGDTIDNVLNIEVSNEELIKRLSGRVMCKKCGASFNVNSNKPKVDNVCDYCGSELYTRDDDNEETVKNRLKVYFENTQPLINFYEEIGLLNNINGERSVMDATEEIFQALDK